MATDTKREAIIEAAFRRFAHFGVPKTTMNEISDDLGISKASLYYYFPDKLNLFAAVLQKIIEEASSEKPIDADDPFEAMDIYLDRRTEFILKYHNILEYLKVTSSGIPAELKTLFESARSMEYASIEAIIAMGSKAGKFVDGTGASDARLLFDALQGLRQIILHDSPGFFPDKKKFQAILKQEKRLARIFLKGLTVQ